MIGISIAAVADYCGAQLLIWNHNSIMSNADGNLFIFSRAYF